MRTQASGIKWAEELDPETADHIRALGISGLDLEAYPQRVYPQASLFANVVGFLNAERQPQAGLERAEMVIWLAMSKPDTSAGVLMARRCRPTSHQESSMAMICACS